MLLSSAANSTLVADSVQGRRVVVRPLAALTNASLNAGSASAGTFTESVGAGARTILTSAAKTGSLIIVSPADADSAGAAAQGWAATASIVDGVSFVLNTGANNSVYNWWIVPSS